MATVGRWTLALGGATGLALARRFFRERHAFDFRGRSVLITGGSRGLGLIMARRFAAAGARLTICARDSAALARASAELTQRGVDVLAITCDVSNQADAQRAVTRAVERYGTLDVLINNAGSIQVGPLAHMTSADFETALAIHTLGPLYTVLAALPHMRRQGHGRIVNIASVGGLVAVPHLLPYCTSKFALVGLSDGLRAELAHDNIRVTTVCPWMMRTGSHVNAHFKGQHRSEFTWFALLDSLPFVSLDADRAARLIVAACRRGDPHLTVGIWARLVAAWDSVFPDLNAPLMALFARLLPAPTGTSGDQLRSGWDSQSELAPSLLTRLSDRANRRNNGVRVHPPAT